MHALALQMPPPPLSVAAPTGVSVKPLGLWDQVVHHPGFGAEPDRIIRIYRSAECGWPHEQVDLFADVIENDGHLRSVVEARTLAVTGKEWTIMPGDSRPQSVAAARDLQEQLGETNFEDLLGMVGACRPMGWGATEIVWERRDGAVVPAYFVTVPFRRFRFDADERPLLVNSKFELTGQPLEPGKWVFARNTNALQSRTVRSGLMRTAVWYSLFKRWSWRDWVIYAEKYGIPLVLGKYAQTASEEQKEELEETVKRIGDDGAATMAEDVEIDIREASRAGGDNRGLHGAIVQESNTELSKLFLGGTLTTQEGGTGSYALGEVHEAKLHALTMADLKADRETIKRQLFVPWLHFNGYDQAAAPNLKVHVERNTDPTRRVAVQKTLWEMGVPLDLEQLREEHQLKEPPTDDRKLAPPAAPPVPGLPTDSDE